MKARTVLQGTYRDNYWHLTRVEMKRKQARRRELQGFELKIPDGPLVGRATKK